MVAQDGIIGSDTMSAVKRLLHLSTKTYSPTSVSFPRTARRSPTPRSEISLNSPDHYFSAESKRLKTATSRPYITRLLISATLLACICVGFDAWRYRAMLNRVSGERHGGWEGVYFGDVAMERGVDAGIAAGIIEAPGKDYLPLHHRKQKHDANKPASCRVYRWMRNGVYVQAMCPIEFRSS
ncbi:hypothetical protein EX30DRAFT_194103 [Ascodesmis nigricans]|uniref:Uncharacterized protein n=1 Tax=Ascodesmis nigricans TaxID=341454 RepID=A0A4S2MKY6_9PEZI|nr:hypothetical protein EX30DRAFT_194103 [Ascodesmis nigricans]